MAKRKIKIRPREAQPRQEVEEQSTPQPEPKSETSVPVGKAKNMWPGLVLLVILGIILVWIFYPFGSSEEPPEQDDIEKQEGTIDLSKYERRMELYASAGYDFFDVIDALRIPRSSVQGILDAYTRHRRVDYPESVYSIYTFRDNPRRDALLIIEPDPPLYQMTISLIEPIEAHFVQKEVETHIQTTSVVLPEPSLGYALWKANIPPEMLEKIEQAFAWTVDLHHLKAGDRIEMVYEEYSSSGSRLGIGRVFGFRFDTQEDTHYAFNYQDGSESFYLDENALSMKKRFLKAPVKYSRITSHYGPRTHPIKEQVHVHRGTDYAAPRGTPVLALADGTIIAKSYTSGNGNFVKIRHDDVYHTQYLHLDRFGETIEPGVRVNQGDVIGYVGSTGLATGPHVCLRLWKGGQQVNFIEEDAMNAESLRASALSDFLSYRDSLINVMNVN